MRTVQLDGEVCALAANDFVGAANRWYRYSLVRAIVIVSLSSSVCLGSASAQVGSTAAGAARPLCQAPYWGGVLAGRTGIEVVIRLFGAGKVRLSHGEGVLTYSDSEGTRRIDIRFFDNLVVALDVWEATNAPRLVGAAAEPTKTSWINLSEGVGTWAGVNVGTNRAAVLEVLGKPVKSTDTADGLTSWSYLSACSCELPAGFILRFRGDRLVSFGIWQEVG